MQNFEYLKIFSITYIKMNKYTEKYYIEIWT